MQQKHVVAGVVSVKIIYFGKKNVLKLEFITFRRQSKTFIPILNAHIFSLARKRYWELSCQNTINNEDNSLNLDSSGKLAENRIPEPNTGGTCYRRAYWKSVYLRFVMYMN
jgi:hypothetical protein